MDRPHEPISENEAALRDRLTRLSEASLRINESLDFDTVLQGVLDSARALDRRPLRRHDRFSDDEATATWTTS